VLREDGILIATSKNDGTRKAPAENAAARAKEYVRRHWKYRETSRPQSVGGCEGPSESRTDASVPLFDRILSHTLCISAMAFQDAWNIDLERLRRCCVHVATRKKKLIPFCAYYLTDSRGRRFLDHGNTLM
jgi:hypothetical protein